MISVFFKRHPILISVSFLLVCAVALCCSVGYLVVRVQNASNNDSEIVEEETIFTSPTYNSIYELVYGSYGTILGGRPIDLTDDDYSSMLQQLDKAIRPTPVSTEPASRVHLYNYNPPTRENKKPTVTPQPAVAEAGVFSGDPTFNG